GRVLVVEVNLPSCLLLKPVDPPPFDPPVQNLHKPIVVLAHFQQ
nr:hypothetical protein [Tanacetum cinerariifolium]